MTTQRATAATRETYGRTLLTMANEFPDIVVLGGDLNVSTFVHLWRDQYPDRFFDFGPAEQNIVGVAAGLAAAGKIPFVSTFSVFGTGRPYDQLRVLISQPSLNVKLVCTHARHPHRRRRYVGPQHRRSFADVRPAVIHGHHAG